MKDLVQQNFLSIKNSCYQSKDISNNILNSITVNLKNASAKNNWEIYGEYYKLLKDFEEHRTGFEISTSCAIFIINDS